METEAQREKEARWRHDQLANVGNELLWRAHYVSSQIQERILRLLEEEVARQMEAPPQER